VLALLQASQELAAEPAGVHSTPSSVPIQFDLATASILDNGYPRVILTVGRTRLLVEEAPFLVVWLVNDV
jgi:hypothetical protein